MADLGYTDAIWLRFFREFCVGLAADRLLKETRDRFRLERSQITAWVAPSAYLDISDSAPVTLSGVDLGTNTAPDGTLYGRISGSGPYTIDLYKATGGGSGDKVATGSANASATATLTAANSSGLTGTWVMPSSVSTTSDDTLRLRVFEDFRVTLAKIFPQDGSVSDDSHSRNAFEDFCSQATARIEAARADLVSIYYNRWGLSDGVSNPTARGNDFVESNEVAVYSAVPEADTSGNVSVVRGGLLERLKAAMNDETTGSEQFVVKRAPSAAAGSFRTSVNKGVGAVASSTPRDECPASRWVFRCAAGTDTGDLGSERFDGFVYFNDGTDRRVAFSGLQVEKQWSHPLGLGPITLTRTLAKTNDGSNVYFAATTSCTITGLNNDNSDNGVLYVSITAGATYFDISFYKSSTRSDASLVSKATDITDATAFTTSEQNGSGLVISWTSGSSIGAIATITLSAQPFYVENDNGVPDEFEVVVTVASEGTIQTLVAELLGGSLNSTTSGSETIDDGYAKINTFQEFIIADN